MCVFLSPPFVTTASLSPPFSCLSYSLLHSATNSPPFFLLFLFLPLWVWLKVTVHTGSLSQRKEGEWSRKKDEGNSENSRGAWGAGRLSTVLCTHHFFALDMIGEVWKDTWAVQECLRHQQRAMVRMLTSTNMALSSMSSHDLRRAWKECTTSIIKVSAAAEAVILSVLFHTFVFLVKASTYITHNSALLPTVGIQSCSAGCG